MRNSLKNFYEKKIYFLLIYFIIILFLLRKKTDKNFNTNIIIPMKIISINKFKTISISKKV